MEQQLDKSLALLEATVGQSTPENAYNLLPDTFRAEISAAEANMENARHNLAAVSGQYNEVWIVCLAVAADPRYFSSCTKRRVVFSQVAVRSLGKNTAQAYGYFLQ